MKKITGLKKDDRKRAGPGGEGLTGMKVGKMKHYTSKACRQNISYQNLIHFGLTLSYPPPPSH